MTYQVFSTTSLMNATQFRVRIRKVKTILKHRRARAGNTQKEEVTDKEPEDIDGKGVNSSRKSIGAEMEQAAQNSKAFIKNSHIAMTEPRKNPMRMPHQLSIPKVKLLKVAEANTPDSFLSPAKSPSEERKARQVASSNFNQLTPPRKAEESSETRTSLRPHEPVGPKPTQHFRRRFGKPKVRIVSCNRSVSVTPDEGDSRMRFAGDLIATEEKLRRQRPTIVRPSSNMLSRMSNLSHANPTACFSGCVNPGLVSFDLGSEDNKERPEAPSHSIPIQQKVGIP